MQRVLVTGAAGFIGSNLVKRCLDEGWIVDGVDDESNGHVKFLPDEFFLREECQYSRCDFTAPHVLADIRSQKYDAVVHLAAVPRVSYSVEHPLETHDVNVTKTLQLIDACKGNVKRFVFASSSSVYGGADVLPTPEHCTVNPKSPYAAQKYFIEVYLRLYYNLYGLDSVALRFFNVFGANQTGNSPYSTAVSAWLTAIKKGTPLRSDGDGSQSRDMCYVDNVTDCCVRAAAALGHLKAECINVACGDRTTNAEILAELTKRYPEASVRSAPWRPGDVMHTQADVTKARELLGYVPVVRFWDGLERTVKWYEDNWIWVKDLKAGV